MTEEGLIFVGNFISSDNNTNVSLNNVEQRAITTHDDADDSQIGPTGGIQFIRGDSVVMIGLVDEQIDDQINWAKVKGAEIHTTKVPSG